MAEAYPEGAYTPIGRRITVADIIKAAADYYEVTPAQIVGRSQRTEFVAPRHCAMYLARELTAKSLPQLGAAFNRDHTTVMSAARRMRERLGTWKHGPHVRAVRARLLAGGGSFWRAGLVMVAADSGRLTLDEWTAAQAKADADRQWSVTRCPA